MQIEGMPEGWELVRIGQPKPGDWFMDCLFGPKKCKDKPVYPKHFPIIRKVEKPKRYRPFANAVEFAPHRDRWCKIGVCESRVLNVNQQHVYFRDMSFTWEQAFIEIIFEDGTPFGVEVTE
jgi:hypothetical protein